MTPFRQTARTKATVLGLCDYPSVAMDACTLRHALVCVAENAAAVANFCDHVEHNEQSEIRDVRLAAGQMRSVGIKLAAVSRHDPVNLYRERLVAVELRNVLFDPDLFDAARAVPVSPTWAELQRVQIAHDRAYHPDVIGMQKLDQLRHYALHLAKLAGAIASTLKGEGSVEDFERRRIPDCLIFGIKLATVTQERLSADDLVAIPPTAEPIELLH